MRRKLDKFYTFHANLLRIFSSLDANISSKSAGWEIAFSVNLILIKFVIEWP